MEMEKQPDKERISRYGTILVVILVVLTVGLLLAGNQLQFSIILRGEGEMMLDYGSVYTEPGADLDFRGSMFLGGGFVPDVEIVTEGMVDTNTVGVYTVNYTASFFGRNAAAQRTVRVVDRVSPELTLEGDREIFLHPGEAYQEPGYAAWDACDGDITAMVEITEEPDGFCYRVTDESGNLAEVRRTVHYDDPVPPQIFLRGGQHIAVYAGMPFEDPGFSGRDNADGDITASVVTEGDVNIWFTGCYTLTYTVTDSFGNTTVAERTVEVVPRQPPEEVTPEGKVIYLTFDDGPGPYTRGLLAVLAKYDVKATFFVVCNKYEDVVGEIAAAGHAVGIHTACHDYRTIYASEEAYFADLLQVQEMILRQTGQTTSILRFPGGSSNKVSRFNKGIMTRLTAAVQAVGFQYFDWNVDSKDAGGAKTATEVYRNVTRGIGNRKVAVVLQHDIKGFSVDAVERIIKWGLDHGYTFRALDVTSPAAQHHLNN